MPRTRRLPLDHNLENLKKQAKTLLDGYRSGESDARSDFEVHHPNLPTPEDAKLTDAQLARVYRFPSWPKLQLCSRLCSAVNADDREAVRTLVLDHPELLTEEVRGRRSHWGAAMGLAANLGRTEIVEMLADMGSQEIQHAFVRAVLQGKIETARALVGKGAKVERGILMAPCENLNSDGIQFILDMGAEICDKKGNPAAPVAMLLETYSRAPGRKHECLKILADNGVIYPETPAMAFHLGRIDLLEAHLQLDPDLTSRRFDYDEIYPLEFRVWGDDTGLHGTPLQGATLLHIAIDFDEREIFDWLLEKGADPNAVATVAEDGFGGHTPLHNCVVKQGKKTDEMIRALLERGGDPNIRASIRKGLKSTEDETVHEYRDVSPIEYAEKFHNKNWVNEPAVEAIRESLSGS
jgi:hypothetical protein